MTADTYLENILQKYSPRDLNSYVQSVWALKTVLKQWANTCYVEVIESGSRAKGTAISIASDVDYLVSLTCQCDENNGGLKHIYNSLFEKLGGLYKNVRKQNVSIRVKLGLLEVDVTPARLQNSYSTDHWIYVSKGDTRQQTNISKHIFDISNSGITKEIKIIKIWRELNKVDFPSIYLEYLLRDKILVNRSSYYHTLSDNSFYIFQQLAKENDNPLFARIVDPANTNNILSDLLNTREKEIIISRARTASSQNFWENIVG